jgi:hypothetical protein
LKDTEILKTFKKNALTVAERFDIKNILPQYEDLYHKAIEQSK